VKKSTALLAATLILATLLAAVGCGGKQDSTSPPPLEKLDLVLDFFPNADHVGIYAAIANGEFAKVGLDVTPRAPSDPAAPLKLLAAGQADLAISYEPELLLARDKGLRLVSVGAIVQKPLTSIIALGSAKIGSAKDLTGKTVGTAGIPYQTAYLKTIMEQAGSDAASVREINVGFNLVPALLSRKVAATLGGFWNYEGVQLQLAKRNPTIIPVDQAGVPTYQELIVVARQDDLLKKGGAKIRRFMRALAIGYGSARTDPLKATQQLVKANPDLEFKLQLASVRATLPVFFPANSKQPFGWQDGSQWARYGAWMFSNGLVNRPPDAGSASTNEFLPGEGL